MNASHSSSMSGSRLGSVCPANSAASSAIISSYSSDRENTASGAVSDDALTFCSRKYSDIQKAFVLRVVAKAQVAGGVGSAPCHCLGPIHHADFPVSNHPQGLAVQQFGAAATTAVPDPVGPCASTSLRAGWRLMVRLARQIEDCWIGDFLGACSLIFLFLTVPLLALGFGGK